MRQEEIFLVGQRNTADRALPHWKLQIFQKEEEIQGVDKQIQKFAYEQQLFRENREEKSMFKVLVDQNAASELFFNKDGQTKNNMGRSSETAAQSGG